jgi:hypothetical protein
MKQLHADPDFKAKLSAAASERMKALNADPDFKAKQSERMKALNADPDFKAKLSAAASERMKALNADPAFNPLAGLSEHQKKIYRKLVNCGVEAERAIAEARNTP